MAKFRLGAILAIPVGSKFALARVCQAPWLAVCEGWVSQPRLPTPLELEKIAFWASVVSLGKCGWAVVGEVPFRRVKDSVPPPTYIRDFLAPERYYILTPGGTQKRSSRAGVAGLETARVYFAKEVVQRLELRLARRWKEERKRFKVPDVGEESNAEAKPAVAKRAAPRKKRSTSSRDVEIFADDVACDVRAALHDQIDAGTSPQQAARAILREFGEALADPEDGPIVHLALAAAQWEAARLDARVKARALAVIAKGVDLRWRDTESHRAREKVLKALEAKLKRTPPRRKPGTMVVDERKG